MFATEAGRKLEYGKLAVVDAKGRALVARFDVTPANRIQLVVDDSQAVYPISIDPLLTQTADAEVEANQAVAVMGWNVASAGDVNRDGYADVIVGANLYDSPGQSDEGAAFVYYGNSNGRPVVTRQRRASGSGAPIQPGGLSIVLDRFVVEHFVASPRGRERAKLEVEICPTAKPFGHVSCLHQVTSSSWLDLGTSGAMMTGTITGLVPSTLYSWRARALYVPLLSLQPGVVPRIRLQGRATPGDVRTVPEPAVGVVLLAGIVLLRSLGGRRRFASM